jgi:hypothetical protein
MKKRNFKQKVRDALYVTRNTVNKQQHIMKAQFVDNQRNRWYFKNIHILTCTNKYNYTKRKHMTTKKAKYLKT